MSQIVRLYDFQAGTKIKSSDVDSELNQLVQAHNVNDAYMNSLVTSGQMVSIPDFMSRQAIINGNFDVAEDGITVTNPANNKYTLDMWQSSWTADGGTLPTTITHDQAPLVAGSALKSTYGYRTTWNGAGAAFGNNAYYRKQQKIERGTRYLCGAGKKITISFQARTSVAGAKRLGIGVTQSYGTGGSPSSSDVLTGGVFTLGTEFQTYTLTINTATLAGKTFGSNNDDYLNIEFYDMWGATIGAGFIGGASPESFIGAGATNVIQFQVCAGEVALPFQPRSYAEELASCQRYFRKQGWGAGGKFVSATNFVAYLNFDRPMRVTPTITLNSTTPAVDETGTATRNGSGSAIISSNANINGISAVINGFSGATPGALGYLISNVLNIDARL